ncbi:sugar kinase [Arthrobacter psychrolactophilus]|uniref:Sugar kinase n=1 Tax=Arthrobacter psychrolactophilus TaxID=92442 RepID=A0A2V5IRF6_9MICC|nr:sugar kinase [Arthrobacter psychrolactophilus]PYI39128.1 sugar kinase [Arthrobacter psychrolactophilus]
MTKTIGSQKSWPEVVTMGETMALMRAEGAGPLQHTTSLGLGIGGAETNFAIALRRLGTSVVWVGRVGNDSLGAKVLRELAAERVETVAVEDSEAPTGLMIKERRTAESQKVWYYRRGSAGSRLAPEDVPAEYIEHARLLHITGITPGLSATAAAAIDHAIEVARHHGTIVSFDLNYRSALWTPEEAGKAFVALIQKADVVFAGDDEAALAVGHADDPRLLAARIAELGPSQVVIKLGIEGCVALVNGDSYEQSAISVRAIDTVGAGDGFVAGYIAELLAGLAVGDRLQTAVKVGAFACLVPGDWEGMPLRRELDLLEAAEPVSR